MHSWARAAFRLSDNEPIEAKNSTNAPLGGAAEWGNFSLKNHLKHDKCGPIGPIG